MRHILILLYVWVFNKYRKLVLSSNTTMKLIFMPGFNATRTFNAKARAYVEFVKTRKSVPGYKAFLEEKGFTKPSFTGLIPNIDEIPTTDKNSYVKKFSLDDRCIKGKVPDTNVIIDESSGSSGTPTNWVRGKKEREQNAKYIQFGARNLVGNTPIFVINAFALGPWATGVNVTMSCVKFSKLKSLGPDKTKIENTLKMFGTTHHYVIMGYPPFLKMLVEDSELNWKEYNTTFIFGGESMSEGMRDYLLNKGVKRIYSSLGASDLELNLGAENDFTISVRKLLHSNEKLRERIVKHKGALPMIFQYNPADFLFETSENGELIITVCRPNYIAPKIRYNIHDLGHELQLKELFSIFNELGIKESEYTKPKTDLPLLLHYGRADMSVSFFGATISPTDVQEAIYNSPSIANVVNSFALSIKEDSEGNKQLITSLELHKNKSIEEADKVKIREELFKQLAIVNQDFREAQKMLSSQEQTCINFEKFGEGSFRGNDIRVKAQYIN